MKTVKLLIALLTITSFHFTATAQGFAKFNVEGAISEASIKNVKQGPSKVEVIVGENVNLKNVKFRYNLLSGCTLDGSLSKDFTEPQTVSVSKNDGSAKEWIVEIKKVTPAPLPLVLEFGKENPAIWNADAKGWVSSGTDESKPTVVRFGNSKVSFIAAYEGEAKEVSFDLTLVGKAEDKYSGTFKLEASADGKTWKDVSSFDNGKITTDSHFTCPLDSDSRFVKWTYKERNKQNVNLNNITIK